MGLSQAHAKDSPPGSAPRRAAAALLIEVLERRRTLDEALNACPEFSGLEGHERAFARAIASAAIRRCGALDAVIGEFMQKPLPDNAHWAKALLRAGAAEVLLLSTPAYAAVDAAVSLANGRARPFAKLINAVLRRVSEKGADILAGLHPSEELPSWLWARWRAIYGDEVAAKLAGAHKNQPGLDVSVANPQDAGIWALKLNGELIGPSTIRLQKQDGDVPSLPGFGEGAWWVQDVAAAAPVRLLGDIKGLKVLDLCAAPGGKTMQLAAAGAEVTAVDRSGRRLAPLRENLERTRLSADVVEIDGAAYKSANPFDAVLVDAPCSATGTLRRHPEAGWIKSPADIAALRRSQSSLLSNAVALVKPGGLIVYCVCSIEPEEGPGIVSQILAGGGAAIDPIAPDEIPLFKDGVLPDGDLRILPFFLESQGGCDGFYAARLRRK